MSPEMPPADKVQKLFFAFTVAGAVLWLGAIAFFVLSADPVGTSITSATNAGAGK